MKDYISINRHLRAMRERVWDGADAESTVTDGYAVGCISDYLKRDVRELRLVWPGELAQGCLDKIEALVNETKIEWWSLRQAVSETEDQLDTFFMHQPSPDIRAALKELLEPAIVHASYGHYEAGHFREAVLNAVMAVFDLLRQRTGLDLDGTNLITESLSVQRPKLKMANLDTQSGRNIQVGFIDMLKGAYTGVRNPKAHSLATDLNAINAAQYLVFASLLARKISTAEQVEV